MHPPLNPFCPYVAMVHNLTTNPALKWVSNNTEFCLLILLATSNHSQPSHQRFSIKVFRKVLSFVCIFP